MAITDPEAIVHRELVNTINEAFAKAYPGSEPVDLPQQLIKRVKMLSDDLQCTRLNWKATEKAYNALDCKVRGIRQHWWQIWRTKFWKDITADPVGAFILFCLIAGLVLGGAITFK